MKAIDSTYRDVERFIFGRVYAFRRRFGGDFDGLLSAANKGFVAAFRKYDPERGVRFITYSGTAVWREMTQEKRDSCKRRPVPLGDGESIPARREFDLRSFLSELSGDAGYVAILAVDSRKGLDRRRDRRWLIANLLDSGWGMGRITAAFREIKEALG